MPEPWIDCHFEVAAPLTVEAVRNLVGAVPPGASLTVKTKIVHGGTQRDPEEHVEVLALCADWSAPATKETE